MTKLKGIMCYGTEEDRQKLAILAKLSKRSQSDYLIQHIRETYKQAFGDTLLQLPEK